MATAVRVRYQTFEFGRIDIHLRTLRDNQQFADPDDIAKNLGISSAQWPIFGIVWPSSMVMSHFLLDYDIGDKRILEVGCGIGLASHLLNHLAADITATDYHPAVEGFLDKNAAINSDRKIPFVLADWKILNIELQNYDLIIGSDLLYEDDHIFLLADFIDRHANPRCKVVIVDPGRGRQGKFSRKMASLGFSHSQTRPKDTSDYLALPYKGWVLQYDRVMRPTSC